MEANLLVPNFDAVEFLNKYIVEGKESSGVEHQIGGVIEGLGPLEKLHEEILENGITEVSNDLEKVWDGVQEIQHLLSTAYHNSKAGDERPAAVKESTELIEHLQELWRTRTRIAELRQAIDVATEMSGFVEKVITGAIDGPSLQAGLAERTELLRIVDSLPSDNQLKISTQKLMAHLSLSARETIDPLLKEDSQVLVPSTFGEEHLHIGTTPLTNSLNEHFAIALLTNSTDALVSMYINSRLSNLRKKASLDEQADFLSGFAFLANFLFRESQILGRLEQSKEAKHFAARVLKEFVVQLRGWADMKSAERSLRTIQEIKRETGKTIFKKTLLRISQMIAETQLDTVLRPEEWREVQDILSAPLFAMADYAISRVEEKYQVQLADKIKIAELEDKFATLDFTAFINVLAECLDLSLDYGFGLRSLVWLKVSERFVKDVGRKLNDCLHILEQHFYEGIEEGRQDLFLRLDLPTFHKLYARDVQVNQIVNDMEKLGFPMDKFTISKKLSVSLLELLITKYSEYLVFSEKVITLLNSIPSRLAQRHSNGLVPATLEKQIGLQSHIDSSLTLVPKTVHSIAQSTSTLSAVFRQNILNLNLKDIRALLVKYFGNLQAGRAGNNTLLMQIEQNAMQFLHKVDQICSGEGTDKKEEYRRNRAKDWGAYDGTGIKEMLQTIADGGGVPYWKEIYIAGIFGLLMSMGRAVEEKIDASKFAEDVYTVRRTFMKTLRYQSQ